MVLNRLIEFLVFFFGNFWDNIRPIFYLIKIGNFKTALNELNSGYLHKSLCFILNLHQLTFKNTIFGQI